MKKYQKTYYCYFDGSCTPINPNGKMGTGVYIVSENNKFEDSKTYEAKIGNTNNVAEYLALIRILKLLKKKTRCHIQINGDSNLVINQMRGIWQIKEGMYKPYAEQAKELLTELKKKNEIELRWIPREQNWKADELSKSKYHSRVLMDAIN